MKHRHQGDIFPIRNVPVGEDGRRRTMYVLECKRPNCKKHLFLTPTANNRLGVNAIVKFAQQKDWYADRTGYTLCPDHRPGRLNRNTPPMKPQSKRAAFLRIRDEHMGDASIPPIAVPSIRIPTMNEVHEEIMMKASKDKRLNRPNDLRILKAALEALTLPKLPQQKEMCERLGVKPWMMSNTLKRLTEYGYLGRVPHSLRWFAIRQTPETSETSEPVEVKQEEAPMPDIASPAPVSAPSSAPCVEQPRQATREQNRLIRDKLDSVYDELAGHYINDYSDDKVARELKMPRAWITAIRSSLYGDDVNEAAEQNAKAISDLAARAEKLEEDALAIATRAEALAKEARKLLG